MSVKTSDGFQLVQRSKRRAQGQNQLSSRRFKGGIKTNLSEELLLKKLENIKTNQKFVNFCEKLALQLQDIVSSGGISEIVCYGLGQFSLYIPSRYQLVALLYLHDHFTSSLKVYDPMFNETEVKILKKFNVNVTVVNEEGKHILDSSKHTLIFMPHCSKSLSNNFLQANWSCVLSKCVILANSFHTVIDNSFSSDIEDEGGFILRILPFTEEVTVECSEPEVFNDTSLHYFISDKLKGLNFLEEVKAPVYKETEFITKLDTCRLDKT